MRYLNRRPTKEDVPREQIIEDSEEVLKKISESPDNFAIHYLSSLLNTEPGLLKGLVLRFFDAFYLYYLKGMKVDQKVASRMIGRKIRHTAREYVALLLGLLKYSGAVQDGFLKISKRHLNKVLRRQVIPPRWPSNAPEFEILKHVSSLPIEAYPELIIFVSERDICDGEELYRVSKLDILLSRLKRRNIDSHEKDNKNAQPTKRGREAVHVLRIKDTEI